MNPFAQVPIRVFVQARMSSSRFPGKVLAPFGGEPMILSVLSRVSSALPDVPAVVATSSEPSDDPLAAYLSGRGIPVFRGPLHDVFERFRRCLETYPCTWIMRISADSPLLNPEPLRLVAAASDSDAWDLITTIHPRTFPHGHNAELLRVSTFLGLDPSELTSEDREHVTPFYYRNPRRFRILNVESGDPALAQRHLTVDTVADLVRLEALLRATDRPHFTIPGA